MEWGDIWGDDADADLDGVGLFFLPVEVGLFGSPSDRESDEGGGEVARRDFGGPSGWFPGEVSED